MPDNGGGAEGNHTAALLQAPAEVHIVTGLAVFGVEAADLIEGPAVKSHVAAGNVFRDDIGEKHVVRSARSRRHARLNPIFSRWRNVGSAHAGVVSAEKRAHEVVEPVGIRHAVAIGINNHIAAGGMRAHISGEAQALVFLADIFDPIVTGCDFLCVVGGSVVHEYDLVARVVDLLERCQATVQRLGAIIRTNNHGSLRIVAQLDAGSHRPLAVEKTFDGFPSGFGRSVAAHESERPV